MNDEDATGPSDAESSDGVRDSSGSEVQDGGQAQPGQVRDDDVEAGVSDGDPDAETVAWVSETDPEAVARELGTLRTEVETLTDERESLAEKVETLEERIQRVQADFQNYKKRMERRRQEEQARATQELVERLLPVRDNLSRALSQDEDSDIRDGVEATLGALDDVLQAEGVEVIEPSPGDSVEPTRHEVVHREDEEADVVASIYRKGYEMADRVLRPAQVTVGSDAETETETDESSPEGEADQ